MKTLTEENFNKEWVTFYSNIEKCNLNELLVTMNLEENLKLASGGLTEDTGIAFNGGLISHINLSTAIAQRIAKMVAGTFEINETSLLKVCCLMHLSKIYMYAPNESEWHVKNLGQNFKFAELEGNLKFGERSVLLATNQGVRFTAEEWEAMESLDKAKDNNGNKYAECILSTVVRQANELAYSIEKERNKKK